MRFAYIPWVFGTILARPKCESSKVPLPFWFRLSVCNVFCGVIVLYQIMTNLRCSKSLKKSFRIINNGAFMWHYFVFFTSLYMNCRKVFFWKIERLTRFIFGRNTICKYSIFILWKKGLCIRSYIKIILMLFREIFSRKGMPNYVDNSILNNDLFL